MKGLDKYIKKHGKHFTEELAYDIVGHTWSYEEIYEALQKKVYYNISGCTSGDIVYCVNGMGFETKKEFVSFLLRCIMCDMGISDKLFDSWIMCHGDFDFTHYI